MWLFITTKTQALFGKGLQGARMKTAEKRGELGYPTSEHKQQANRVNRG